jgi:hypothetical protein
MRSFRSVRLGSLLVASLLLLALFCVALPASAEGPNLLQNPGFERPYVPMPVKENCRIAASWVPYYYEGVPEETTRGYRLAPEYKAAFWNDYPYNRVRSGELSQQYFHSFSNFQGGVLQQVSNVAVGSGLRFEMWAMTWSCDRENKGNCQKATSGDPSPMHLRIGIDPMGGTSALSPAVVWSAEQNAYDAWTHFQVDAVAKSSNVTVFVYAYPDYRSQDNNVYLDDASLTVIPVADVQAPPAPVSVAPEAAPAAPTAVENWPVRATLAGNHGGAFVRYEHAFAASGPVTLKMWFNPYSPLIAQGVGFNVYGPAGTIAQGKFAGTQGGLAATFAAVAGQTYQVQVYNYLDNLTVSFELGE